MSAEIPEDDVTIQDDTMTSEEAIAKSITILGKSEKIKLLSELTDQEIRPLSMLYGLLERTKHKNKMLESFLNSFLELRVSKNRQGRREFVTITSGMKDAPEKTLSGFKKIMGLKG